MSKTSTALVALAVVVLLMTLSVLLNIVLVRYRVVSTTSVYLDGQKVKLSVEAFESMENVYSAGQKLEIPMCLGGRMTDEGVEVLSAQRAVVVDHNESYVSYVECPLYVGQHKTIGTIHNHPNDECRLSDTDVVTYVGDMQRGQEMIGLYCGEYVFYVLSYIESEVIENGI